MKFKSYKSIFWLSVVVLLAGLFSCEKEVHPWSDDLDFPPSFFAIGNDSLLTLNYSHEGRRDTISLKGDVIYKAQSDADWISVPTTSKRHSDLILYLKENKSQDAREGNIVLTSLDTLAPIVIKVSQEGAAPFMKTSKGSVALNSTIFSIEVEENIKGYFINAPWWITVADSIQINDFTTKYVFDVAPSYFADRTGELVLLGKGDNTNLKDTVVIKQLKTKFQDPGAHLPIASLFDVAFTAEGAKDYSPSGFDVTTGTVPDKPTFSFDNDLNRYVATFDASKQTHLKLDYNSKGKAFSDKFSTHFTLEACFKPDLSNSGLSTVVGSLQYGGVTIEYDQSGTLVMKLGSQDKGFYDYFTIGSFQLQAGQYYDVVYTVNYGASKAKAYVNGALVSEVDIDNSGFRLPFSGDDQWFGIGCNESGETYEGNGDGRYYFSGNVAFVRFYSDVKAAADIQAMYNQVLERKSMTGISDLNNVITNVLPQELATATQDQKTPIQQAINIGWKLMDNSGTTDEIIQTYLDNVDALLNSL